MGTKFAVFLFALFCNFAADYSVESRKLGQRLIDRVPRDDQGVAIDKAEWVWNYCRKRLDDSHNYVKYDSTLMVKTLIQNSIVRLPLKEEDNILDCNRVFQVLNNELETGAGKFGKLFSSWDRIPRRYLRDKEREPRISRIASSPVPAASPEYFAATPIYETPGPSPSPYSQPPASASTPVPSLSPEHFAPASLYELRSPLPSLFPSSPAPSASSPSPTLSPDYLSTAPEAPPVPPSPQSQPADRSPKQSPATNPPSSDIDPPSQFESHHAPSGSSPEYFATAPIYEVPDPSPSPHSQPPATASTPLPALSPKHFAPAPLYELRSPSPSPSLSPSSPAPSASSPSLALSPDYLSTAPEAPPVPPSPMSQPADRSPKQPPATNPPSQFKYHHSPGPSREDNVQHDNVIASENASSGSPQNDSTRHKYIAAVAVTGSVAVCAFVALCFLLYPKKRRVEPDSNTRQGEGDGKCLRLNSCCRSEGSTELSQTVGAAAIEKDFSAPEFISHVTDTSSLCNVSHSSEADEKVDRTDAILSLVSDAIAVAPTLTPTPPPGPPPPPPPKAPAPAPPPPPKAGAQAPNRKGGHRRSSSGGELSDGSDAHKAKLKPFFWDKVTASPSRSMVWNEIKSGSFQIDEKMMENLFGYVPASNNNQNKRDSSGLEHAPQLIQIIEPKKAQNLAILLKASGVTMEEICDALKEGHELPVELCQSLSRMAPTTDEELKLRLYTGDLSLLGPAERFLKVLVDIPFAFKRLESLLFISTFQEEFSTLKETLETIELACNELKNNRLFFKLLEAVLKTGNRMNVGTFRGGASAFKLDALLKLSDVKGTDGKTTLLHFVVQEICRSEGARAVRKLKGSSPSSSATEATEDSLHEKEERLQRLGLEVVSGLSSELENVKKASVFDAQMVESVSKLGASVVEIKEFLEAELKDESEFFHTLTGIICQSESDIKWLREEDKRIKALMKSTGDYFHGKSGKDEGLRLFSIVGEFLSMLDKTCKDVERSLQVASKAKKNHNEGPSSAATSPPQNSTKHQTESLVEMHQRLFPAMRARQLSEESDSSSGSDG